MTAPFCAVTTISTLFSPTNKLNCPVPLLEIILVVPFAVTFICTVALLFAVTAVISSISGLSCVTSKT